MTENNNSKLIAAFETVWRGIQRKYPEVPGVAFVMASGSEGKSMRLGHFAADRWQDGDGGKLHELFVGGESLSRGAAPVMGTLLHEAAHALAHARGVQDTSRQGRYHNKHFKALGEELGLTLELDSKIGWSVTTMTPDAAARWSAEIGRLERALWGYRATDEAGAGRKNSNNGLSLSCPCGRKLRMSRKSYELGTVTCGLCGGDFDPESDDELVAVVGASDDDTLDFPED